MATTISKRITALASGGATQRVVAGSGFGATYRTWGNSWGDAWADTWRAALSLSQIGHTGRVTAAATASNTQRVTGVA